MKHPWRRAAYLALAVAFLGLASCYELTPTSAVSDESYLFPLATQPYTPDPFCESCPRETLAALQTEQQGGADARAAATAVVARANAQATVNSASSTLSAALTQEQNNTNIFAAQVAATAAIVRANAQATLASAGSTQSASLTQDAINQTQSAAIATQEAVALATQQNNQFLASITQTAVSDNIATQTQSALATDQWYGDQERQRAEQRQVDFAFLWMWCPPIFVVLVALIGLLFFWRWIKMEETQQRLDAPPPPVIVLEHQPTPPVAPSRYPLGGSQDHVRHWLEEVKRNLSTRKKDNDDHPRN